MKTRKVTLYVDLQPGWQDFGHPYVSASSSPYTITPNEGTKRFAFEIELPEVGHPVDGVLQASTPIPIDIK